MIALADIQGHWVRDWIKAPGFEDHTTRVHWLQVGSAYADLRIPMDRPDITGAGALSDLSPMALAGLAQAEGFAGAVTLSGHTCTWRRDINWHGQPQDQDVGDISFDAQGRMIETGVFAEYAELWSRQDGADRSARQFAANGYLGFLVTVGDAFVLGIGTPKKPASKPVVEALSAGHSPADIDAFFDGIHAYGHWTGDTGIAELATQPFSEGKPVVSLGNGALIWHRTAFGGQTSQVELAPETAPA